MKTEEPPTVRDVAVAQSQQGFELCCIGCAVDKKESKTVASSELCQVDKLRNHGILGNQKRQTGSEKNIGLILAMLSVGVRTILAAMSN